MEQCQHVISVDSLEIYKSTMGHSVTLVGIIFGTVFAFTLYTLGIFSSGFVAENIVADVEELTKMTMSPVTYTSVRGVQNPRVEYSPLMEGCWES